MYIQYVSRKRFASPIVNGLWLFPFTAPPPPPPTEHRELFRLVLQDILVAHHNFLFCVDYNTTLQPQLDSLNAAHPESWEWLRDQVHGGERQLLDAYRVVHPTSQGFTRYAGGRHSSAKRLDMALASRGFGAHFPLSAVSVQELDRTTGHHPVSVAFGTDFCPPTPGAPPPTRFYRTLTAEEQVPFRALLSPVADWCAEQVEAFDGIPVAAVQERTEAILKAVSQSYTFVTNQHLMKGAEGQIIRVPPRGTPGPGLQGLRAKASGIRDYAPGPGYGGESETKKKVAQGVGSGSPTKKNNSGSPQAD